MFATLAAPGTAVGCVLVSVLWWWILRRRVYGGAFGRVVGGRVAGVLIDRTADWFYDRARGIFSRVC
jgi:hypothetical protein